MLPVVFSYLSQGTSSWNHMTSLQRGATLLLAGMVVYSLVVVTLKARFIYQSRRYSVIYAPAVAGLFAHQKLQEALELSTTFEAKGSHIAGPVRQALEKMLEYRTLGSPDSSVSFLVRETLDQHLANTLLETKAGLGFLDAIGRTAPFVGAAVGTQIAFSTGTLLAIVTLWFATYFRARIDEKEVQSRIAASEFREIFARQVNCSVCGRPTSAPHGYKVKTCEECCAKCYPKPT